MYVLKKQTLRNKILLINCRIILCVCSFIIKVTIFEERKNGLLKLLTGKCGLDVMVIYNTWKIIGMFKGL